jgi:hypothetical protein
MRHALVIHPSSVCPPVAAIAVEASRPTASQLSLGYELTGETARLFVPPRAQSRRTDELWKRTCFEAFILPEGGEAYLELNLAPSTRWAAYRFDRHREGMRDAAEITPKGIDPRVGLSRLTLTVTLDLAVLPDFDTAADWRIGLTAVIEETEGRLSYWSLAHPLEKPEFHHADGWIGRLPNPDCA